MGSTETSKKRRGGRLAAWATTVAAFATLALVPGALAVHDAGLFELDANAVNDAGTPGDDWSDVFAGSGGFFSHHFIGASQEAPGSDATFFTGGGSKDVNDIPDWDWSATDVSPDKDQITDAYAASYAAAGSTYLYFGMDRFSTEGSADIGFWFFQNPVDTNSNGTFSGMHTVGDILVLSAFNNGGSVSSIEVYKWVGGNQPLQLITSAADCQQAHTDVCARVNNTNTASPWPYTPKSGSANTFPANSFFEGGVNLDDLFGSSDLPCFSSFLAETRSSSSLSAQLKDFALGNVSSCGSVVIRKVAQGGDESFSYTGTGTGIDASFGITTSSGSGSKTFTGVKPGTKTVTEGTPPSGWELVSISCDDSNSTGSGSTATINVEAGETVTCTFTNRKQGTVIVKKVMEGGTDSFSFTGTPAGTISTNNGTLSADVPAGTYTSTEGAVSGWDLASISCDDTDSTGDTGTGTATFHVAAGETVTCTFTNRKHGTVVVKKVMEGGTSTFSFTGTPSGSISSNNGTISAEVSAGQHTSTEGAVAGWDLASISCDDGNSSGNVGNATATFNVEPGETVTCTFTNRKQGKVIVKKVMQGGTDSFDFTGTPSGTISTNNGTISADVAAGTYTSTESAKAGWDLVSVTCDDTDSTGDTGTRAATFHVAAGETVTCTFTNRKHGTVIVKKVMQEGTGSFDFTGTPAGTISTDGGTISADVSAGQYTSTEGAASGWDLVSVSCDDTDSTGDTDTRTATFNVAAGETVTCTFTNFKRQESVDIEKATNGEDADDPTGPVIPVGDSVTWTYVVTNTGNVTLHNVTVTDDQLPASAIDCGGGSNVVASLDPADSATCTATGTAEAGQYANTGTAGSDEGATDSDDSHYLGAAPSLDLEKATNGEDADDPTGPFVLAGDTVTWTYVVTNTGNVPLTNVVVTDSQLADAAIDCGEGTNVIASLAVEAQATCTATGTATAGQYANTGTATSEEGAEDSDDSHYFGAAPAIGIVKNPDSQTFLSGGTANFTITVTNPGNVPLTGVHVDDAMSPDCARTAEQIAAARETDTFAPGDEYTYTCSRTGVTASFLNTATATGTPPVGPDVTASDTANVTVTLPPPPETPQPIIDLAITKTDNPDPVTVNNQLTYTVTVTNNGPSTATGVHVADQLPAATTFVSVASSQGTCSQAAGVVSCNLGTMASGATVTITVVVRPTATGTILNTAMVAGNEAESTTANNVATEPTLVVGVLTPPAPTCSSLTVTPRQLTVGKRTTVVARVRLSNGKPFARARVRLTAPGITVTKATGRLGIAKIRVRPTRAGIARVTVVANPRCSVRRVGIVGVFRPPLTG